MSGRQQQSNLYFEIRRKGIAVNPIELVEMIKNTLQKLIKMSFVLGILFQAFSINAGQLSIVIDDIGYHAKLDSEVYSLPRSLSCYYPFSTLRQTT